MKPFAITAVIFLCFISSDIPTNACEGTRKTPPKKEAKTKAEQLALVTVKALQATKKMSAHPDFVIGQSVMHF
jgi:hypothetical protein